MDSLFRMFLSFRPPFSGLNGQHWGKRHTLTVGPAGLRGRVAGQRGRRGPLTFPGAHSDEAEGGGGDFATAAVAATREPSWGAASTRSASPEEAGTAPAPPLSLPPLPRGAQQDPPPARPRLRPAPTRPVGSGPPCRAPPAHPTPTRPTRLCRNDPPGASPLQPLASPP